MFVRLFRNGDSLQRYLSHVRSVLLLLRAPLGALADTERLVRGAEKITPDEARRVKVRATADETRKVQKWTRAAGYPLIADSWIVCRHFCLRYSEVISLGQKQAAFAFVQKERLECTITFLHRKCFKEPCQVLRRCICELQGRSLCGVCTLRGLTAQSITPFSEIRYTEALAVLKLGAATLGLANASSWGTHAFRRGFANEALQAGGPGALFFSGGWRGITAPGYASAQSRGALAAAEWLVEHSDSSSAAEP